MQEQAAVELLSRDAIMSVDDMDYEIVDVPEWGGKVRVRSMTGSERDAFEASLVKGTGKQQRVSVENIRAKLVALTVVDMEGNRIFNDKDITFLGRKSAAALDRVYEVSARLSKISKEDVDELAGNSESGHSDDS